MLLPVSEIAVGHCVIGNETECPEGRMVCVITAVDGEDVYLKYLNAEKMFDGYNKRKGWKSKVPYVTPLATFGVSLAIEPNGNLYTCRKVGESKAVYADGGTRPWQEREPRLYRFRRDVAEIARQTAMAFTEADKAQLRAIVAAAAAGELALVQSFGKHDGDPVKLLCRTVAGQDGQLSQVVLAEMPDREPLWLYEDPSVSGRVLKLEN